MPRCIALSILGVKLDFVGKRQDRWNRWRPNVGLCSQDDLLIDELHLIHDKRSQNLAEQVISDINSVSPETQCVEHLISFDDPWDFEEVYAKLFDWCSQQDFAEEDADYLFHITTGTHVSQICAYLLTESRHFPGRLIQTSPDKHKGPSIGRADSIDLDLSKYDQLATRFDKEHQEGEAFLKGGITTDNIHFNQLISQVEKVAIRSKAPILLTGPTGAGKSQLASRIYQLKKRRAMLGGHFVSVNCATLKGENAMAALFGHTKGAFTGAQNARDGFLLTADQGCLFLDEVAELGLEEQAMLLHALESKTFFPVGSDKQQSSDFQLIVGTNQDLRSSVTKGLFREDLLARINLWSYQLPGLAQRREDIPANIDFELQLFSQQHDKRVDFNKEARRRFIKFGQAKSTPWPGNFRDLNAAIVRMATLADSSRISLNDVEDEIERLNYQWQKSEGAEQGESMMSSDDTERLSHYLSYEQIENLDSFDRQQLTYVISVCEKHDSLAAAGRELFNVSRIEKKQQNDSSRLQKYLAKFELKGSQFK